MPAMAGLIPNCKFVKYSAVFFIPINAEASSPATFKLDTAAPIVATSIAIPQYEWSLKDSTRKPPLATPG